MNEALAFLIAAITVHCAWWALFRRMRDWYESRLDYWCDENIKLCRRIEDLQHRVRDDGEEWKSL
jgi:uncharacterized protein YeeX (DUF496 family)